MRSLVSGQEKGHWLRAGGRDRAWEAGLQAQCWQAAPAPSPSGSVC